MSGALANAVEATRSVVRPVQQQQSQPFELHYNKVSRLKYDRPVEVMLYIDILKEGPGSLARLPGAVKSETIPVTRRMEARLGGTKGQVRIEPANDQEAIQTVTDLANPTWKWNVTALTPNDTVLDLSVYAHVISEDGTERTRVKVYSDKIPVETDIVSLIRYWIGQIDPIWKWLIGVAAALAAALAWVRKQFFARQ